LVKSNDSDVKDSWRNRYSATRESLKKLIFLINDQTVAVLQYINDYNEQQKKKKPEDRKGLTKDTVAREMYVEGVCSRLTTLRILNDLLSDGIIIDMKEKEKTFARLEINKDFDWEELRKEIIHDQVKKALAPFEKIADRGELNIRVYWNRKGLPEVEILEINTTEQYEKSTERDQRKNG
jgi:hypothetical protein